jgi:pentatricopeptide repeat protein
MQDLYSDYEHSKLRMFNRELPSLMVAVHVERSERTSALLKGQALQNKMAKLSKAGAIWSEGKIVDVSSNISPSQEDAMYSPATLAALQQQADEDYSIALKHSATSRKGGNLLTATANSALLRAAGARGDIDTALAAFGQLEGKPQAQKSRATAKDFEALLSAYAKSQEWQGVDTVFDGFLKGIGKQQRDRRRKEMTAADLLETSATQANPTSARAVPPQQQEDPDTCVWNAMIHAKLMQKEGPTALELLEEMMSKQGRAPKPVDSTLLSLVKGFVESGELDTAFRWADRMHTVPTPPGFPNPPPKLEDTLNTIIAHSPADIAELQSAAKEASFLAKLGQHITSSIAPASASDSLETSSKSPSSPASSSYGLGSVFSDTSIRTQSLTVTPPELASYVSPDAEVATIDTKLSGIVDELIRTTNKHLDVYGIIKSNRRDGKHVHPDTLARVVKAMSNMKPIPTGQLQDVYQIAYNNIGSLASREEQASAWAYLEDRMLIAMANLGELDKVAMHRDRLLQAGAAPSADAYAAMINCAKDTTDDATVARELFEEALRFGVVPNLYLYNILISKLSKARRTHLALSYFEQMKQARIRPSTVTYGSVIAGEFSDRNRWQIVLSSVVLQHAAVQATRKLQSSFSPKCRNSLDTKPVSHLTTL